MGIDEVDYWPTEDSVTALKRFRAGELDIQNPIPATQIDWLRANMGATLRMRPFLAISYMPMNTARPPLNDARIRKALNLAFDREIVTRKVLKLGDPPAYGIVPPGIANYPGGAQMDFARLPAPARLALAQQLMHQAGYGPDHPLHLTLETTHDPDNKRVAAVLQAMVKPLSIDLEISSVEQQVHYRNLQIGEFEIATAVWVADFNDASNFLDLLQSASGNNYAHYRNPTYDAALAGGRAGERRRAARQIAARRRNARAQGLPVASLAFPHEPGPRPALGEGLGAERARLQSLPLALDRRQTMSYLSTRAAP